MKKHLLLFVVLALAAAGTSAQNQDSLLQAFRQTKDLQKKTEILCELSAANCQENYALARQYALKALNLSKSTGWAKGRAKANMVMGYAYDFRGNYDSAVFYYLESLKIYEQEKDLGGQSAALNNLGICFFYSERMDEALVYYERSLEIEKKQGNESGMADSYNNVATVYRNTGRPEMAEKYFIKARDLYTKNKLFYNAAGIHINLGLVYMDRNELPKAIAETRKGLQYYKNSNQTVDLISCYNSLGDLFLKNRQVDSAAHYAKLALDITRKADMPDFEVNALRTLVAVDTLKKDYAAAVRKMISYQSLTEKLHQDFKNEQIEKYRNYYDLGSKEKAITTLETEKADKDKDLDRKSGQLTLLVIIVVVFAILLAVILYTLVILRRTKQNVEEKNKVIEKNLFEKDILLKEIHHRVKNNLQVVSSLLSIQARYVNDPKALQAINDSKDRVRAISLLHQEIYRNEVLKSIYADQYFNHLCNSIQLTFDPDKKAALSISVDHVMLDIDLLVPYGLMVNELLTNAYKYGVHRPQPQISLQMAFTPEEIRLVVADNGPGMQNDFDIEKADSLGYRLVTIFAQKLGATINVNNQHGCSITITSQRI